MSWFLTYRGRVEPHEIDALGHMNIQHYMGRLSIAGFAVSVRVGIDAAAMKERRVGLAMLRCEIDFRRELSDGEAIRLETHMDKVGTKSLSFRHRLIEESGGAVAMEAKVVAVCIDMDARTSIPLPQDIADRARALIAATQPV
jgi:acyl-CoA thioester hydrolase